MNRGADGYIPKPVKMIELLTLINDHLKRQQEERKYSEEKVAGFIKTRANELESRS